MLHNCFIVYSFFAILHTTPCNSPVSSPEDNGSIVLTVHSDQRSICLVPSGVEERDFVELGPYFKAFQEVDLDSVFLGREWPTFLRSGSP